MGFPLNGRVQERILTTAAHRDARVIALESAYVQVVLQACAQGIRELVDTCRVQWRPFPEAPRPVHENQNWEVLDEVNLVQVSKKWFAVLQSCPFHLRGRFLHAARVALQARHDAVIAQDARMETRVWKLFALLPFMLLRRPKGQQKVGKDELRARFDKFGSGQFAELLADRHSVIEEAGSPVPDLIERRAAAAG